MHNFNRRDKCFDFGENIRGSFRDNWGQITFEVEFSKKPKALYQIEAFIATIKMTSSFELNDLSS